MDIIQNWPEIRTHFSRSFGSSLHVSIASLDENNHPTCTPIGSLFLNKDQSGFYFEKYPSKLPRNASNRPEVCILAVNSSRWFWLKSLFLGQFPAYPAIKLHGKLGKRRKGKETELKAFQKRMRMTKLLKGHHYLWSDMEYVRDIHFTRAEKINLGKMTEVL